MSNVVSIEGRREQYLDKPLPSSDDSERVILGAILNDNDLIAEVAAHLVPEDFYSPLYRRIYTAILALANAMSPIDAILISEELKKEGNIESMGGIVTITNLTYGLPYFSNIDDYIKIVGDKASLRNLIRGCNQIIEDALAEDDEAENVRNRAEETVYKLCAVRDSIRVTMMHDEVAASLEGARERKEAKSSLIGIPSGFSDVDSKLQGYRPGQFIITAARPSIGKTAIVLRELYFAATVYNTPVVFFSVEMGKEEIADRIVCAECNIESNALRSGYLSREQWEAAEAVRDKLQESSHFFILDCPGATVRFVRTELRRVDSLLRKEKKKIGLVAVDHIGLMANDEEKRGRSREREVSEISLGLKRTAREFKIPIHALSQVSRAPEGRSDHRLLLSDLRDSGGLEQDADVVRLLYREDYYQKDPSLHTGIAEVNVAKNRNGPTGLARLYFERKYAKFSDLSQVMNTREQNSEDIIL